ncbi:MAG: hypothetical protein ABIP07_02305 [Sphingomicrobium sp.]
MTAIAAVIALSSTSSFAQSVETPAPVVESTPIVTPVTPDPLAADPIVTTSAAEPVASETAAPPAATARRAAKASRPAARTRVTTRTVAAAPAVAATAAPAIAAPVEPIPAMPEMAAPAPVEAIVEPTPVATETVLMDEALPIAGAAGLGLLALAGAGFAMRRRRRRAEDAINEAKREQIDAAPEAAIEPEPAPTFVSTPPGFVDTPPGFVDTPMADPVPLAVAATASELPDGFDVSKFGPHVQAAYHGPTADNPSASLKRRLTTGHFLDKKALEANPAPATAASEPVATPAVNATWKTRGTADDFMFRRSDSKPKLRPVHQK